MDGQKGQRMTGDKNDSHILHDTGWTCDQQVAGSNPGRRCNTGEVVFTHVLLSPSSIVWYRPVSGDAG